LEVQTLEVAVCLQPREKLGVRLDKVKKEKTDIQGYLESTNNVLLFFVMDLVRGKAEKLTIIEEYLLFTKQQNWGYGDGW
jgi:hypothetical protein